MSSWQYRSMLVSGFPDEVEYRLMWALGLMSVRHNWLVCKLHNASTVDKKALPSSREEFQFSLISRTCKSTGTRALPICTSRPRWSAITLGRMLTDAHVLHKACGNSIPFTVHEHSLDVFFFLPCYSEEHPQSGSSSENPILFHRIFSII
ncbi:hypothetical protein F2Q69_00007544 [Brassica cretica]|uniref:Uncharacterized protein n=1 Tax=Brassica cretica TaxID=69181 RepID=A0A8S9NKU7_BRACR|nr:hypothetical protein F2Q69_00007544 [Brassica cretica]